MQFNVLLLAFLSLVVRSRRTKSTNPISNPDTQLLDQKIKYRGGPIMTGQVNTYHVYYGDWSYSTEWNKDGKGIELIEDFARNIGKSDWYKINKKYYQRGYKYVSDNVVFRGGVQMGLLGIDKTNLSKPDILELVDSLTQAYGSSPDPNGVYFVITSPDIAVQRFCDTACGWHNFYNDSGTIVKYAFAGVPPTGCPCFEQTSQSPNGLVAIDAMLSTYAHELVEAISDPELSTWFDDDGNENADKCAWSYGPTYISGSGYFNVLVGSKWYYIQQNWDPEKQECATSA